MRIRKLLAPLALIAAGLFVAAISFGATQFPTVVPTRAALGALASSVAASLSTAQVNETGHFGVWTYSPNSTATPDGNSVIEPSDDPANGRWLLRAGTLNGSVTFTVCSSGCDFGSMQAAIEGLGAYTITPNAIVNLDIPCATTLTSTTPVTIFPPVGGSLYISGCAHTLHTVTSVVSSSGSAGAWSIVLQMGESVANITAGNDYVIIHDANGGANPTRLVGVWPVTATNAGSNQITIATTNLAAAAPSGAVAASVSGISSVMQFNGSSGLQVWAGASVLNLQNVVVAGNKTAGTNGLDVEDNGRAFINSDFGAWGFGQAGIFADLSAEINATNRNVAASNNKYGIEASGAVIVISPCVVSGNSLYGISAQLGASVSCTVQASGNGSDGINASTFSVIELGSGGAFSNDNGGWGAFVNGVDWIDDSVTTETGNTLGAHSRYFFLQDGLNAGAITLASPTGGYEGGGTINLSGGYYANGNAGQTCTGSPTASFATIKGIVTHC